MKKSLSVSILARKELLSDKDWYDLLERRRALVLPYLKEMELQKLGDLRIVGEIMGSARELRMGSYRNGAAPLTGSITSVNKLGLDTLGVFPDDAEGGRYPSEFIYPAGSNRNAIGQFLRFWGLTAEGEWIRAEAKILFPHDHVKLAEVVGLNMHLSTPAELWRFCHQSPLDLWKWLGKVARAWRGRYEQKFKSSCELTNTVDAEEVLAGHCSPSSKF